MKMKFKKVVDYMTVIISCFVFTYAIILICKVLKNISFHEKDEKYFKKCSLNLHYIDKDIPLKLALVGLKGMKD
jgi:hypothetical protein